MPVSIVVFGVSGCGKSTVGQLIADRMKIPFFDADDFHPDSSVVKMKSGIALSDQDRKPWLERLSELLKENPDGSVLACSALKNAYREILRGCDLEIRFVHLSGEFDLILKRMVARDHFMPTSLLENQFSTLEPEPEAFEISIKNTPESIADRVIQWLKTE